MDWSVNTDALHRKRQSWFHRAPCKGWALEKSGILVFFNNFNIVNNHNTCYYCEVNTLAKYIGWLKDWICLIRSYRGALTPCKYTKWFNTQFIQCSFCWGSSTYCILAVENSPSESDFAFLDSQKRKVRQERENSHSYLDLNTHCFSAWISPHEVRDLNQQDHSCCSWTRAIMFFVTR